METTTAQQATEQMGGWQAAAQDAQPQQSIQQPQATQPAAQAEPQQQQQPAGGAPNPSFPQTTPPATTTITPVKRGGLLGVIDDIADAVAGTKRPEFGTDDQGNKYVKERTLTRGEQWAKIGAEALAGAARGYAAGQGAGGEGRAASAGIDTGLKFGQQEQQRHDQMNAEARQQNLDNANNLMTRMKLAEESWKNTRMQVEATQHDVEFAQGQEDRLVKEGGTVLGHMQTPGDITAIKSVNPDVFKDLIQHQRVELVPHFDADGRRAGFTVVKMPDGYRSNLLPAGAEFKTFDPTSGKYVSHKTSDPITAGEVDDYNAKAALDAASFAGKKAEADLKAAQTAHANAQAETENQDRPGKIAKTRAETAKDYAEAGHARAETTALQNASAYTPQGAGALTGEAFLSSLPESVRPQVKAIARGDIKLPSASMRSPAGMALRNAVLQYDPTFTDARYDAKQNFKTKGDAQTLSSLTMTLHHAENALQHSAGVGFAPLLGHNATAADATYNQDVKFFANEAGKLVKNGVLGEKEYEDLKSGMQSSRRGIRDAAINETIHLLGGKIEGSLQKYKTATGFDLDPQDFFDRDTQQRMTRYGIGQQQPAQAAAPPAGATMKVPGSDGKLHWSDGKTDLGVVQ